MIYSFLTSEDLEAAIKTDFLTQISSSNATNIFKAESEAVSYAKDFIAQRYDVNEVFPKIGDWSNNRAYGLPTETTQTVNCQTVMYTPKFKRDTNGLVLNYTYRSGKFYQAVQDNTNHDPATDTTQTYWQELDPRDGKIVAFVANMAVFNLHRRINPRQVPQIRIDFYNQAKEWLTWVKDGDITPADLPKPIDKEKDVDEISFGGNKPRHHYY